MIIWITGKFYLSIHTELTLWFHDHFALLANLRIGLDSGFAKFRPRACNLNILMFEYEEVLQHYLKSSTKRLVSKQNWRCGMNRTLSLSTKVCAQNFYFFLTYHPSIRNIPYTGPITIQIKQADGATNTKAFCLTFEFDL